MRDASTQRTHQNVIRWQFSRGTTTRGAFMWSAVLVAAFLMVIPGAALGAVHASFHPAVFDVQSLAVDAAHVPVRFVRGQVEESYHPDANESTESVQQKTQSLKEERSRKSEEHSKKSKDRASHTRDRSPDQEPGAEDPANDALPEAPSAPPLPTLPADVLVIP